MTESDDARQRLDLFLFRTRFFKSRGLAGTAIIENGARITRNDQTRRVDKASASISAGDVVSFTRRQDVVVLEVLDLPKRRGPAAEAATFFAIVPPES